MGDKDELHQKETALVLAFSSKKTSSCLAESRKPLNSRNIRPTREHLIVTYCVLTVLVCVETIFDTFILTYKCGSKIPTFLNLLLCVLSTFSLIRTAMDVLSGLAYCGPGERLELHTPS